jgi:hypothetical protein
MLGFGSEDIRHQMQIPESITLQPFRNGDSGHAACR